MRAPHREWFQVGWGQIISGHGNCPGSHRHWNVVLQHVWEAWLKIHFVEMVRGNFPPIRLNRSTSDRRTSEKSELTNSDRRLTGAATFAHCSLRA